MIFNITQKEMREMALDWIDPMGNIIELGCSDGNFAEELRKKGVKNYIGIDIQSDKINEARKKFPEMNFVNCDITKNLYILKQATTVVSFQCLEHIKNDLDVLSAIPLKSFVILSVPNRKYKGHIRWFELDGWRERFSPYLLIDKEITIQHPDKPNNRTFLFIGIRNGNNN